MSDDDGIKCPECGAIHSYETRHIWCGVHCEGEDGTDSEREGSFLDVYCPHCDSFYKSIHEEDVDEAKELSCSACTGTFLMDEEGNTTGLVGKCPYCDRDVYNHINYPPVECSCGCKCTFEENGKPKGICIYCPFCNESTYSENFGTPSECLSCKNSFTLNEQGELEGSTYICPDCRCDVYTEETGKAIECPNCDVVFNVNNHGDLVGFKIYCPNCSVYIFLEFPFKITKCNRCNKNLTIDECGELVVFGGSDKEELLTTLLHEHVVLQKDLEQIKNNLAINGEKILAFLGDDEKKTYNGYQFMVGFTRSWQYSDELIALESKVSSRKKQEAKNGIAKLKIISRFLKRIKLADTAREAHPRAGFPWLQKEDEELLSSLAKKVPLSKIAERHKRSRNAILKRIADIS